MNSKELVTLGDTSFTDLERLRMREQLSAQVSFGAFFTRRALKEERGGEVSWDSHS